MQQQHWVLANLPASLREREIDQSVVELLSIAAVIGGSMKGLPKGSPPITFATLLCAFLFGDDPASRWLQQYYGIDPHAKTGAHKGAESLLGDCEIHDYTSRQRDGVVEPATGLTEAPSSPPWTRSVQHVLERAAKVARLETLQPALILWVCGIEPPRGHDKELRDWQIGSPDWQAAFRAFADQLPQANEASKPPAMAATTKQDDGPDLSFLARPPNKQLGSVLDDALAMRGQISTASLLLALASHGQSSSADPATRALFDAIGTEPLSRMRRMVAEEKHNTLVSKRAEFALRSADKVTPSNLKQLPPDMLVAALLGNSNDHDIWSRLPDLPHSASDLQAIAAAAAVVAGGAIAERWATALPTLAYGDPNALKPDARRPNARRPDARKPGNQPATPPSTSAEAKPRPGGISDDHIRNSIADVSSDLVSAEAIDHLGVEREAKAFARVAASSALAPPISIGVFGEWGSGKTFFMEKMHRAVQEYAASAALAEKAGEATAYHQDVVQIRFNAWHYMESNLWASLVDHIFRKLDDWLQQSEVPEPDVRELYDQLATARALKFEALESLIQARKQQQRAEHELSQRHAEIERLESQPAAVDRSKFWQAVANVVDKEFRTKHQEAINKAVNQLGFDDFGKSAKGLFAALEQSRASFRRSEVTWRALVKKVGSPLGAALLVACILIVPVLLAAIVATLGEEGFIDTLVQSIGQPILAIAGAIGGASGWIGVAVHGANKALAKVEGFQAELDKQLQKPAAADASNALTEDRELLQHQAVVAQRRTEAEVAANDLTRAGEQVAAALQGFHESARGRLHRFIREKIKQGDYAKHLGIIATIRKDFEQLAQIMVDEKSETQAAADFEGERQAYASRLEALGIDSLQTQELLTDEEAGALRDEATSFREEPKQMRFFRRIVLYIDDLDRCPPEKVVEVLQACHLLLCFPLFVVVVAVDARWVSRALVDRFPGLLLDPKDGSTANPDADESPGAGAAAPANSPHASGAASPRDYLEKIFQIPYWVRRMQPDASKQMVSDLAQYVDADPLEDQAAQTREQPATPSHPPSGTKREANTAHDPQEHSANADSAADAATPNQEQEVPLLASSAAPTAVDPNPRSLLLSRHEHDELMQFAPFAGTSPRTLKRFVNVYRILRTSLPPEDGARLVGEDGGGVNYRAIIGQLAIVTGAPALADCYFTELFRLASQKTPNVAKLSHNLSKVVAVQTSPERASLQGSLALLAVSKELGQAMFAAMRAYASIVRRYSFTARDYL